MSREVFNLDGFWLPTNEGWLCVNRHGVVLRSLAAAEESLFALVSREEMFVEKRTAVVVTHPDGACCVGLRMSI